MIEVTCIICLTWEGSHVLISWLIATNLSALLHLRIKNIWFLKIEICKRSQCLTPNRRKVQEAPSCPENDLDLNVKMILTFTGKWSWPSREEDFDLCVKMILTFTGKWSWPSRENDLDLHVKIILTLTWKLSWSSRENDLYLHVKMIMTFTVWWPRPWPSQVHDKVNLGRILKS